WAAVPPDDRPPPSPARSSIFNLRSSTRSALLAPLAIRIVGAEDGGADDARVVAELRSDDVHRRAGDRQRLAADDRADDVDEERHRLDHAPTEHDAPGVVEVDRRGEGQAEVAAGLVDRLQDELVALLDRLRQH